MLFDPGCGCCGCTVKVRAIDCDSNDLKVGLIVAYDDDGKIGEAVPSSAAPYWATFKDLSGKVRFVPGALDGCELGLPTTIDPVECGGEYAIGYACHRPIYRIGLASTFSCINGDFWIVDPHDMEFVEIDGLGYWRFRVTGPNPYIMIGDVNRKLGPLQKVIAPATMCPPPAEYGAAILDHDLMSLVPGWACCPWIDDGAGRTSLFVATMVGDRTVSQTMCDGSGVTIAATVPHCVIANGEEDCSKTSVRQYPIFGDDEINVGFTWELTGDEPKAYQHIRHYNGLGPNYGWWPKCPKNNAEILYANARRQGVGDATDTMAFAADRYTVHSRSSPASVTFEWDEIPGIYDPKLAADWVYGGSPVPGSITITEKMA